MSHFKVDRSPRVLTIEMFELHPPRPRRDVLQLGEGQGKGGSGACEGRRTTPGAGNVPGKEGGKCFDIVHLLRMDHASWAQ